MPANLHEPFAPSCCEAGGEPGHQSAQNCGCDPGANHLCERHTLQQQANYLAVLLAEGQSSMQPADPLRQHFETVVQRTWNFSGRLTTEQHHQQNALVGLASEAGELLDIGKKMWFHDEKPAGFFREKLLLELGDVLYYFLKTLDLFGFTLSEVIEGNRRKLESRHPELGKVAERFQGGYIR